MEQYINEHNKICWKGVTINSPFGAELFHYPEWQNDGDPEGFNMAFHSELGSLTMCNRMTGFGFRDTESAYRDKDGRFWLAAGNFDIRHSGVKTVGEAIELVKKNANVCNPDKDQICTFAQNATKNLRLHHIMRLTGKRYVRIVLRKGVTDE